MKPFPHFYKTTAGAGPETEIELTSNDLTPIMSAAPTEFGGSGDRWSPETLFVGAVADCFVLTFRARAKASRLSWTKIICEATGRLDVVDGVTRFTGIDLHVRLNISAESENLRAHTLLKKAEESCLIRNSLRCEVTVHADVRVESPCDALALP
jgi:peroxiredoxin-like protein